MSLRESLCRDVQLGKTKHQTQTNKPTTTQQNQPNTIQNYWVQFTTQRIKTETIKRPYINKDVSIDWKWLDIVSWSSWQDGDQSKVGLKYLWDISNLNYSVVSLYRTWTSKYFHDGRQCHRPIFVFLLVNSRHFMISTTEVLSLIYFLGNAENILPSTQGWKKGHYMYSQGSTFPRNLQCFCHFTKKEHRETHLISLFTEFSILKTNYWLIR